MKEYKHKIIQPKVQKYGEMDKDIEEQLNDLVNDGWKIIDFEYYGNIPTVLLQRWE